MHAGKAVVFPERVFFALNPVMQSPESLSLHRPGSVLRTLSGQVVTLVAARWFRDALETVLLVCLARTSTATYGEFMLALAVAFIPAGMADLGLNHLLVVRLTKGERNSQGDLAGIASVKSVILLTGFLGLLGFTHWQGYSPALRFMVLILAAGFGLEALASTLFVVCETRGQQHLESKVKSLAGLAAVVYGLISLSLGCAPWVLACYKGVEGIVTLGGLSCIAIKQWRMKFAWPVWQRIKELVRGSLAFTFMALAALIYNKANLVFLKRFGDSEALAQYSATWQVIDGISCMLGGLLLQSVLFPLLARLWHMDRPGFVNLGREACRWVALISFPVMFFQFFEADRLIPLIYGAGFERAVWLQRYLVPTIIFALLHNLAAYLMISMGHAGQLLLVYLTGLAFNLTCCWLLIPQAGLLGAALTIVLTKGLLAFLTISCCQRRVRMFGWRSFMQLLLVSAGGGILYLFVNGFVLRGFAEALAVLPVVLLGCFWYRTGIKNLPHHPVTVYAVAGSSPLYSLFGTGSQMAPCRSENAGIEGRQPR
jgi:O-antigen/teichoic acid export membrane protein